MGAAARDRQMRPPLLATAVMTHAAAPQPLPALPGGFGSTARTRIQDTVLAPDAAGTLHKYFAPGSDANTIAWTGGWFERLGDGGDNQQTADVVGAPDIIAVSMLRVDVPARVSANLLEGPLGRQLSELLARIPVTYRAAGRRRRRSRTRLGGGPRLARTRGPGGGIGWVLAGKVLARKRPHLVPVYEVVKCWLGAPSNGTFWESVRVELQHAAGALTDCLEHLKNDANLPSTISVARVLDVLLYRRIKRNIAT